MRQILLKRWIGFGWAAAALLWALALAAPSNSRAQSGGDYVAFTIDISHYSNPDRPKFRIVNRSSRGMQITNITIYAGQLGMGFDAAFSFTDPPAGTIALVSPDQNTSGDIWTDRVVLNLTGFDPGEEISFYADVDPLGQNTVEDYRKIFFSTGSKGAITCIGAGRASSVTMHTNDYNKSFYSFSVPKPRWRLTVRSETESGLPVAKARATVAGNAGGTNIGAAYTTFVEDGETIEVTAPQLVYKNINGVDITDSVAANPVSIQQEAEERFNAIGISVNDVAQTGDPTLYRFDIQGDTTVLVKWRHEYALTVKSDFAQTASQEQDATGQPWAGPLSSDASGNPLPEVKKHWIRKGETAIALIDGQTIDFSRPGLDIRYVVKAYTSYGPANSSTLESDDNIRLQNGPNPGVDIRTNLPSLKTFDFDTRQAGQRQQVPQFTMYGPAGVRYLWQIQFGVRVNMDDPSRAALPKIFTVTNGVFVEKENLEGVFWFDPGTRLRIGSAANSVGSSSKALSGWFNGDGFYFSSSGDIDSTTGGLINGGPLVRNGSPVAVWTNSFPDGQLVTYRGLEIPQLRRPARVMWRYGDQQLHTVATLGEHVFQHEPTNANRFANAPDEIQFISVSGLNKNVNASQMAVWDPAASRLYPLVPGIFRALWKPTGSSERLEVLVTAIYPTVPHYPHIAGTPPVALDPDPDDDFIFKELKYTENNAIVDGTKRFISDNSGRTVLLFSTLQKDGRGDPREFLAVRVVETKRWNEGLPGTASAIIGRKITDPILDGARLGTGYLMFEQARYNPFVYDRTKLEGIASKDIYDRNALLPANGGQKIVINRGKLPGPIIPVNLDPGAPSTNRIVIVWYADPSPRDGLLWPARAQVYLPRWPTAPGEGLGRIVIASQHGSESVDVNGNDQEVAEAVTAGAAQFPATSTYDPSRLQQVQIYSQADRTKPGYNPNEEHALTAPSLRYVAVSPRPPAIYALRDNDLNRFNRSSTTFTEGAENPATFTSHPFVLVQYLDTADNDFKMRVYQVVKEDPTFAGYTFAPQGTIKPGANGEVAAPALELSLMPHVRMKAGEPVIPFYPLGVVIGASPCAATFGVNIKGQTTYWEDHKGTSWSISGGSNAWFTVGFHYPLAPDFWWPPNEPGFLQELLASSLVVTQAMVPQAGDCVSFLPPASSTIRTFATNTSLSLTAVDLERINPVRVLFKSDWPNNAPILKAGETLTFQGGEYRSDHPVRLILNDAGEVATVETPGLPQVTAFASAEVVFDSLNPLQLPGQLTSNWTARVGQVLDKRTVPMSLGQFPPDLQPATKRTRVKQGKYLFTELPASLQKRFRYDPLAGKLEMIGLLNEKEIGDRTLTASPSAVYILEPNIITAEEEKRLRELSTDANWLSAVADLVALSRNPNMIDSDNPSLPNATDPQHLSKLRTFWTSYYQGLGTNGAGTTPPPPIPLTSIDHTYLVGLAPAPVVDGTGKQQTINDPLVPGLRRNLSDPKRPANARSFGPGLALLPNGDFLNPSTGLPAISYISVVENNDPSLGGSPITVHIIQVDRRERYRGAIKTVTSDNVFDENLVLRHTGDFAARADDLVFEWWYRPDDGSLNVPPPDLLSPGAPNPWKLFPDPSGNRGLARYQVTLKGNPNAPEALLADTFWFVRYRHRNDLTEGTDWRVPQNNGDPRVNFTWAGAGNSDPFNDFDNDGVADYRAQLAQGWIKRVLDAVNPYEARIRDFEGENPATRASMISQFGPRFEGAVALNPDKNVIENVGLIELYETILKRGRDLSIDLSRPVSSPAIANALQLASTRIADFYTILGQEAYTDALDPTIGFGSDSVDYGSLAPSVFTFQNQQSSLIDEELGLLRGVDDYFARPVFNRLYWNFTKGEGEAAYAQNYNVSDMNQDGFIDEKDAMILYPQGHGDAWGHYLTAVRNQYELLQHPNFNWVSRSEFYNLQDIVIKVDFLDERKFAQTAAARAKTGAEIVNLTYRQKYVDNPNAQWQGYRDSNADRAWGVEEWSRRAGQGAYFDWITANALLPSQHPNETLEGIQKVDRKENSDISVISANLNAIQTTLDQANKGHNPLGLSGDALVFDLDPTFLEVGSTAQIGTRAVQSLVHFDQIYERALKMLESAVAVWDNANQARNMLRQVGNSELEFRNSVYQEDLSYRNQLIKIFGKPYEGTVGPGRIYPAGYSGPDLFLFMYVDVRAIDDSTVPGPTTSFATFNTNGTLNGGDIYEAFKNGQGKGQLGGANITGGNAGRGTLASFLTLNEEVRKLFSPSFAPDSSSFVSAEARNGLYGVHYTDLVSPKVPLANLTQLMPVTAQGYTFQAPRDWGARVAAGELQLLINQMLQQEAQIASAIGVWDGLQGEIVRTLRVINAKLDMTANIRLKNELFSRLKLITTSIISGIDGTIDILESAKDVTTKSLAAAVEAIPTDTPTVGLAVSPGDVLAPVRGGLLVGSVGVTSGISAAQKVIKLISLFAGIGLDVAQNELDLFDSREEDGQAAKEMIKELEGLVGDEPIRRIEIFKEVQALRALSDQYRATLDEGIRLIDERAAYNKRVAAQTQRNRYQDMTFRVARNHALQTYRSAFDLAARYSYLAAKAYDYETNLDPLDPGSASTILAEIMRARTLGQFDGEPRLGGGGLAGALAKLNANYQVLKGQLGINNPEIETGKISLRTGLFRILPSDNPDATQPGVPGFPAPGDSSADTWRATLEKSVVPDLWQRPEYRYYCRPFAAEVDASGNRIAEPGLVIRFATTIKAGENVFGKPLSGGDHFYDPSHFATKIQSAGIWFSDYLSADVLNDLPSSPRVYLIPVGNDIMSVPTSQDPGLVRIWKVLDQRIPVPIPATTAALDSAGWTPLLDGLNGRMGERRKYSMFRAYHDGGSAVNADELVTDTRLVGRSVWNTQWVLIVPGRLLNSNPNVGLQRFINQVTDIKLVFRTYSLSGG